ncbi:TrmH family RNA methyltransferase [Balneatrix alpica]|uniref:TrmH family RNA methyltransferase n=1 Tax=Balneatrix alpica TaxID=75684 RepID=A0ABV5ZC14_9GAMM|nr:RNA methyltransferase [Balneatrix alpica]
MNLIQSAHNTHFKHWKKLLNRKEREQSGQFLVEGWHLCEEALQAGWVEKLIVQEGAAVPQQAPWQSCEPVYLPPSLFQQLCDTETPQGVLALCRQAQAALEWTALQRLLLLDGVQDPGNLGTLIRTADAAGLDGVLLSKGCVDPYNPKVLRAAQGSHFHLPLWQGCWQDWLPALRAAGIPCYGSALQQAKPYTEFSSQPRFALVMGNEGAGINPELLAQTDANLYIPLYGKSESLNVAIAAGILLYHLRG